MVSPDPFTCGEVLNDAGRGRMEDDVGTVIQVMQVVATVKASVAKHVVESQLLLPHKMRGPLGEGRAEEQTRAVGTATQHRNHSLLGQLGTQGSPFFSSPRCWGAASHIELQ